MVESPEAAPASAGPATRSARTTGVLLAVALVVLVAALVLPWWSETEVFGPVTWVQEFSPFTGVRASCAPSCGALDFGPPTGPLQGTSSFSSVGLHDTGILYEISLGLVVAGVACTGAAIALWGLSSKGSGSSRRSRAWVVAGTAALLSVAVGAALLPALQPSALRADTVAKLSAGGVWTASPSPETSFIGECQRGAFNGVCASGGSATWGPGIGWLLLVVATGVLILVLVRNVPRGERPATRA